MEVGSEQDGDGQMSDENGDDMGAGRGHMVDGQGIMGDQESMVMVLDRRKMGRRITKTGMVWRVTQWRIEVVSMEIGN